MKAFADLFDAIDRTTSTNAKVDAMAAYFALAPHADAAWAVFFLTGRRLKRFLPAKQLAEWTMDLTGVPEWLLGECYGAVGDLGETLALLVDGGPGRAGPREEDREGNDTQAPSGETSLSLAAWMETRILPLPGLDEATRRASVQRWWMQMRLRERFILNKILTGEFRVGVSHTLVVRSVAKATGLDVSAVAHRLMGQWQPSAASFAALVDTAPATAAEVSRPYPFQLAQPLDRPVEALGAREAWAAEWKWDGIRAQLIVAQGPGVPLVARRGAHHRAFPRDRACSGPPARRHGARRRGPAVPRRATAWVRRAAAAHRPATAGRSRST